MSAEQLPLYDGDRDVITDTLRALVAMHTYDEVAWRLRALAPTTRAASAPARWSDPETSHMAAKREHDVGRFSDQSRQSKLLYLFSARGAMTDQQAAIGLLGPHAAVSALEGCRRRCSDLRAVRFLYDTGRRHCNMGSNDESIVWALSDAGRDALVRLDETGWSR